MLLEIISPDKVLFTGEVQSICLPGTKGPFMVLDHHAPLISSLSKGVLRYQTAEQEEKLIVNGGFVEVSKNMVTVCLELVD